MDMKNKHIFVKFRIGLFPFCIPTPKLAMISTIKYCGMHGISSIHVYMCFNELKECKILRLQNYLSILQIWFDLHMLFAFHQKDVN